MLVKVVGSMMKTPETLQRAGIGQRAGSEERAGIGQRRAAADRIAAGELPVGAAVDCSVAEVDKIGADAGQGVRGGAVRDEFQRVRAAPAVDPAVNVGAC